jgi:hypothetical protein
MLLLVAFPGWCHTFLMAPQLCGLKSNGPTFTASKGILSRNLYAGSTPTAGLPRLSFEISVEAAMTPYLLDSVGLQN